MIRCFFVSNIGFCLFLLHPVLVRFPIQVTEAFGKLIRVLLHSFDEWLVHWCCHCFCPSVHTGHSPFTVSFCCFLPYYCYLPGWVCCSTHHHTLFPFVFGAFQIVFPLPWELSLYYAHLQGFSNCTMAMWWERFTALLLLFFCHKIGHLVPKLLSWRPWLRQ